MHVLTFKLSVVIDCIYSFTDLIVYSFSGSCYFDYDSIKIILIFQHNAL